LNGKDQVKRHLRVRLVPPGRVKFHAVMAREWHEILSGLTPLPGQAMGSCGVVGIASCQR